MGETLIERRRVQEEGLRVVNCFSLGTSRASLLFGTATSNMRQETWFIALRATAISLVACLMLLRAEQQRGTIKGRKAALRGA